jgi:hypothetical protein
LGPNKVVGEALRHDEVESVVGLGFDVGGRLISGGGSIVKVWQEKMTLHDDDGEETSVKKRALDGSDSDDGDGADAEESSDEEEERKRKKKRRKGKGKHTGNGILGFKGLE